MPIIFAQAIMFLPLTFLKGDVAPPAWIIAITNYQGFWYNFTFAMMIIAFTYFYTAITINPQKMAEDIRKNGGFIPGIKPGKRTVDYFDNVLSKITLPGSIFLAFVAVLPAFAMMAGITNGFAQFYGGTSLLILVGVVMDTLQQIESHLLMRHYDGLMKTGKVKGKVGSGSAM
jgi:preprotein translocase subunit SecY